MGDSTTKRCTKCGADQPRDFFTKAHWTKDGLYPSCKACKRAQSAAYKAANPEKVLDQARRSQSAHAEKHRIDGKRYYAANREQVIARTRQYTLQHPEMLRK